VPTIPTERGIGQSVLTSGRLRVEDMAADVLAVADVERLQEFHLVGHSMGGLVAQKVALTAPARVLSLALMCTSRGTWTRPQRPRPDVTTAARAGFLPVFRYQCGTDPSKYIASPALSVCAASPTVTMIEPSIR